MVARSARASPPLLFGMLVCLSACNNTPADCILRPYSVALFVTVTDSATGQPAASGAIGVAQRPGLVDTMSEFSSLALVSTKAGAGTYDVTISKAGYGAWTAHDIQVSLSSCTFHGGALNARLQPAP